MSEKVPFRTIWHAAGIPGVVLASVSIAYLLINQALIKADGAAWASILNFICDLAKIVGCILLMKMFMVRFKKDNQDAGKQDIRRVGTMTALLSALIYAAATMAYYMWNPETVATVFEAIYETAGSKLDNNMMGVLDKMEQGFPRIMFVSQLIYCFLYGWVLSSILAPRIVPDNPFSTPSNTFGPDEQ